MTTLASEADPSPEGSPTPCAVPHPSSTSAWRTLCALAWPLILSNSFTTIQITVDRVFLSNLNPDAVSAATSAMMLFWCPFVLLFSTSQYVGTFVAQYHGAGRKTRVGAAVWQGLYFSIVAGFLTASASFFATDLVQIAGHSAGVQALEAEYLRCLCWMGMPVLIVATTSAFFSGRGDSRTVIWINLVGTVVNGILDWCWIFGNAGFPAWGIAGAGWATVVGAWASALLGLGLMLRKHYRTEFDTLRAWRWEGKLFKRLMRYGLPSGVQWTLDTIAFTAFLFLMGWFGDNELAAASMTYTINSVSYIPMIGMGTAVSILVGQYLGKNEPESAARVVWTGLVITSAAMIILGLMFVVVPSLFLNWFASEHSSEKWQHIEYLTTRLLWFVALYSLFDGLTITFSCALRGAGDTLFVTLVSLVLAWPLMVIPTWLCWKYNAGVFAAWWWVTLFIATQGVVFLLRFRGGKWKSMRVIEPQLA